jgi:hypothetical protein
MGIVPRVGRPAKRAVEGSFCTLTVRVPAGVKNWLVDQAAAFDMSLTEFLIMLVGRNAR